MLALTQAAREKDWRRQHLDCRNTGDLTGERGRAAGAGGIVFCEANPETYGESEKKFLLNLARKTLARAAANPGCSGPQLRVQAVPSKLAETKGCFVTLTEHGELRGCIGHIFPKEPLYQAIEDNVRDAATRDPRFLRVQPKEVDKIKIEISVLTKPQPLWFHSPEDLLDQLQPYDDGVVLQIGSRSATFLPQVWERIPDKIEFLNQLSEKAGYEPSAWRGGEASVSVYHVEAFKESE